MNATKELKIITQKLNNFDFGARVGMLISIVSPRLTYSWLLLVNREIGGYFYIMVDDYTTLYIFYSNFKKFIMDSYFSIDFFLKVSNV
jgi:hypothetical protein